MILNDGHVDISTEVQRGKGRETGIKGTIPSCPGPALFWKKKKKKQKKKNITYLHQGFCLHILEAGNSLFAFK